MDFDRDISCLCVFQAEQGGLDSMSEQSERMELPSGALFGVWIPDEDVVQGQHNAFS